VLQRCENGNVGEEDRVLTPGISSHIRASETCLVQGYVFGAWRHRESNVAIGNPSESLLVVLPWLPEGVCVDPSMATGCVVPVCVGRG
jgi:hypothetical protein